MNPTGCGNKLLIFSSPSSAHLLNKSFINAKKLITSYLEKKYSESKILFLFTLILLYRNTNS